MKTSYRARTTGHGRVSKILTTLAFAVFLVATMQGTASAHAVVTDIEPYADSVLGSAPKEVKITFNEPVSATGTGIRVFDPSGAQISGLRTDSKDTVVSAELPALTEEGSYTVSWKVVSADGHAIDGAFLFSVGKASLSEPLDIATSSGSSMVPRAIRVVGGVVGWAGLVMVLYTLAIAAHARFDRGRAGVGAALVVVGALLSLVGSLLNVDGSVSDMFSVTARTTSGMVTFVALGFAVALAAVVVYTVRQEGRLGDQLRRLVVVIALLTVAAIALEGHAVALSPVVASAVGTVLHVVAAIVWLAGLLWIDRRSRLVEADELRRDVAARSPYAMVSVTVLAITGIGMYALRMPADELISSAYGLIGGVKIIILAMALVLAWQNRSTMTPLDDSTDGELERSHRDAVDLRRFRSSLRAETIMVAVALVLGVVLAQISPPGADAAGTGAGGGYFSEKLAFGDGKVELTVDPAKRGVNEIHVTATGSDGRLMEGVEDLKLSLYLTEKDLGPLQPSLQVISVGHSYTFARIPFAGEWTMKVTATVNRFDELEATFDVPVGN